MEKKLSNLLWFTGLSGSGKTTLANIIYKRLKELNFKVYKVDGDLFRKKNKNNNKFTKRNIINNNNKIISHVKKIDKKFDYIIVSVISPLLITRLKAKKIFGKKYSEIYIKCELRELFRRDPKGLYKKAREKKLLNLIGYNSKIKYEKSKYKKIIVDTEKFNIQNSAKLILEKILK